MKAYRIYGVSDKGNVSQRTYTATVKYSDGTTVTRKTIAHDAQHAAQKIARARAVDVSAVSNVKVEV